MRRLSRTLIPVLVWLIAIQVFAQNSAPQSKILSGLTSEQIDSLQIPRSKGLQEINSGRSRFDVEAYGIVLPENKIALARVTDFRMPDNNSRTLLHLHVEQVLRGHAARMELTAETCWNPNDNGMYIFNMCQLSNLARTKPEIGAEYLIGYRIFSDGPRASISGALVMDVPEQAAYLPEIQRFINFESEASDMNLAPFMAALNDSVPWIQNVAERRLESSAVCRSSPDCLSAIATAAARNLASRNAANRWRALSWVYGLSEHAEVAGRNPVFRQLLSAAANDPNAAIAQDAFSYLVRLDFLASAKPGECIEIVPALRKTAHWTATEAKAGPTGGPLWSVECAPDPRSTPAQ